MTQLLQERLASFYRDGCNEPEIAAAVEKAVKDAIREAARQCDAFENDDDIAGPIVVELKRRILALIGEGPEAGGEER